MMKKTLIALAAGAGALGMSVAFAGDKEGGDWEAKVEEGFAKVDANSDGQVTKDEYIAYKMTEAEKYWEKYSSSAGDDGQVSLAEAKAHHQAKMAKKKAKKEM
ncbi:MAG: hypothetical protein AAGA09_05905 [Pseudomonadota bacterium]